MMQACKDSWIDGTMKGSLCPTVLLLNGASDATNRVSDAARLLKGSGRVNNDIKAIRLVKGMHVCG